MLKRLVWARLMIVLALIALPPSFEAQESDTSALRQTFAEATAAYRDKAFDTYLSKMESLAAKRPTHPTILYRLAGAFALNKRPAAVARVLNRLADLTLTYDVGSDPDFAAVRMDDCGSDVHPRRHRLRRGNAFIFRQQPVSTADRSRRRQR
jgi:hypothetical protein